MLAVANGCATTGPRAAPQPSLVAKLARVGGVTRPCFVTDARRVILPAFGAYTGGLDTGDPAQVAVVRRVAIHAIVKLGYTEGDAIRWLK